MIIKKFEKFLGDQRVFQYMQIVVRLRLKNPERSLEAIKILLNFELSIITFKGKKCWPKFCRGSIGNQNANVAVFFENDFSSAPPILNG